jgi:hypothetical protein
MRIFATRIDNTLDVTIQRRPKHARSFSLQPRHRICNMACIQPRCTRSGFAFANHILHTNALKVIEDRLAASIPRDITFASSTSGKRRDIKMLVALEINFALWGMIVCGAMEAAHLFE